MPLIYNTKKTISNIAGRVLPLQCFVQKKANRYILAYHRVLPQDYLANHHVQSAMWVDNNTFDAQLSFFQTIGDIVKFNDIIDFSYRNTAPMFCITFDDGWVDNYEHAFPILKEHNATATIFLATEAIEKRQNFWPEEMFSYFDHGLRSDRLKDIHHFFNQNPKSPQASIWNHIEHYIEELKLESVGDRARKMDQIRTLTGIDSSLNNCQLMDWQQIAEMHEYGINFQSHTHTHRILKYASDREIYEELTQSKALIGQKLGKKCDLFCYPNARYPHGKEEIYQKAGYSHAVKIDNKILKKSDHAFFYPRLLMSQDNSANQAYLMLRLLGTPFY